MWMGLITMGVFVMITWAIGRSLWLSHTPVPPSPYELDSDNDYHAV